jgi:hypothetical protein
MTPRSGLFFALVGLVMAALCLATLFILRDWKDPEGDTAVGIFKLFGGIGFILFLDLGAILGLIVVVVGLVFALKKQSVKPS